MPIFCVKSVKIYTGPKKFTRIYSWGSWQIWGMDPDTCQLGNPTSDCMSEWVTEWFHLFWVVDAVVVIYWWYFCWYYCCCDLLMLLILLLLWPVHLCEDLLRSAVTIGTKHLVHSLNNPENIKIWNMKMNTKKWNIKILKDLVHSLNNPENMKYEKLKWIQKYVI